VYAWSGNVGPRHDRVIVNIIYSGSWTSQGQVHPVSNALVTLFRFLPRITTIILGPIMSRFITNLPNREEYASICPELCPNWPQHKKSGWFLYIRADTLLQSWWFLIILERSWNIGIPSGQSRTWSKQSVADPIITNLKIFLRSSWTTVRQLSKVVEVVEQSL
jgi:hypothetical protein